MNRLKELRQEQNMKQEAVAAYLSVKRQTISRYETGGLDLDTDTICRLCDLFGVTADYLLGRTVVRDLVLTGAEWELVAAYRLADEDDRFIVDRALKKYMKEKKEAPEAV